MSTSSPPPTVSDSRPRIGLALSGGGMRAMLFHLGVVRYLRDTGRPQEVEVHLLTTAMELGALASFSHDSLRLKFD